MVPLELVRYVRPAVCKRRWSYSPSRCRTADSGCVIEINPRGECHMSRIASRTNSPNKSRIKYLLIALLAMGLSVPALAQSVPFPTYSPGQNTNATTGPTYCAALVQPVGRQRRHNPHPRRHAGLPRHHDPRQGRRAEPHRKSHRRRASNGRVTSRHDFQHQTGAILQTYSAVGGTDPDGSTTGISYTPDGKYLLFSQDGNSYYGSLLKAALLPSPASARRACSQTTPTSAFRWMSSTPPIKFPRLPSSAI